MKDVIVTMEATENNYSAIVEGLDGFVCTASSIEELKKEVMSGILFHIEGLVEDGDEVPEVFKDSFQLVYKWNEDSKPLIKFAISILESMDEHTQINDKIEEFKKYLSDETNKDK